jgi:hypothetical protein
MHTNLLRVLFLATLAMEGSFANVSQATSLASTGFDFAVFSQLAMRLRAEVGNDGASIMLLLVYILCLLVVGLFFLFTLFTCFARGGRNCEALPIGISGIVLLVMMGTNNSWAIDNRHVFLPIGLMILDFALFGFTAGTCIRSKKLNRPPSQDFSVSVVPVTGRSPTTGDHMERIRAKNPYTTRVGCWPFISMVIIIPLMTSAIMLVEQCKISTGFLGSKCNAFCKCGRDVSRDVELTCHPGVHRCYPREREAHMPCTTIDNTNKCQSGLTCPNFFLECSDGSCGSYCNPGSCAEGLKCVRIGGIRIASICVSSDESGGSSPTELLATCLPRYPTKAFNASTVISRERYSTFEEFPECRAEPFQQGCCGSCVAFGVSSSIAIAQCVFDSKNGYGKTSFAWRKAVAEAMIQKKQSYLGIRGLRYTHLSEEHLLACSFKKYPNLYPTNKEWKDTCDGFDPNIEMSLVRDLGIRTFSDQAYVEGDNYFMSTTCSKSGHDVQEQCAEDGAIKVFKGCTPVLLTTTEQVKAHIAKYGAATATLKSSALFSASLTLTYSNEVLSQDVSAELDHTVLVYGWGKWDNNKDYLMVHNSWGPSFGAEGTVFVDATSFRKPWRGCIPAGNYTSP